MNESNSKTELAPEVDLGAHHGPLDRSFRAPHIFGAHAGVKHRTPGLLNSEIISMKLTMNRGWEVSRNQLT